MWGNITIKSASPFNRGKHGCFSSFTDVHIYILEFVLGWLVIFFPKISVFVWNQPPNWLFFVVRVSQVLCSLQVAPVEVFGHQESNQNGTDGGTSEGGVHESGQAQIRSCKSFFFFFPKKLLEAVVPLKYWVGLPHPFSFPFSSIIPSFFMCMLACQSSFTIVLVVWAFERNQVFFFCSFKRLCMFSPNVCVRVSAMTTAWPDFVCMSPDQRRRPAVQSHSCCLVWRGWWLEWQLVYTLHTIASLS